MFTFLLILQTLVAAGLVTVILMQRSEGGGLGVGGSSSGLMTARGAADFLTRSTAILGGAFVILSIALAAVAGVSRTPDRLDTSLARDRAAQQAPAAPTLPGAPLPGAPAANPLALPGAPVPAADPLAPPPAAPLVVPDAAPAPTPAPVERPRAAAPEAPAPATKAAPRPAPAERRADAPARAAPTSTALPGVVAVPKDAADPLAAAARNAANNQ